MTDRKPYYVTTPIYYVNDRPHVGHCYTTMVADCLARFHRLDGRDVFFLTGTDEHSERVASAASERGLTPMEWADRNAAAFQRAFTDLGFTNDDFIRTTEPRHKDKVVGYVKRLMDAGDVFLGEYSGWWDHSQEEYLTETVARENEYKSPVTGKPLDKRTEQNYFFKLSKYQDRLLEHIETENPTFVAPGARRNEVLGRLKQGLQDVPISRAVSGDAWGIHMPGDENHTIYVWIDALFNYFSAVDTDDRRKYWPADEHLIAKDILWFHAVIWPCMLMALDLPLPRQIYAHSYWIREGRKMSKSLGNFIDMPTIHAYRAAFGDDPFRWYMLTQGPLGATDADFAHAKFIEVYNADLANGIGNAASRVTNMIAKYFDGACPEPLDAARFEQDDWREKAGAQVERAIEAIRRVDLAGALRAGVDLSAAVDEFVHRTEPFKRAKDETKLPEVATILYQCAEALRIAAVLLTPAMPTAMGTLLERLGQTPVEVGDSVRSLCAWGALEPGTRIVKGEGLFPRADPDAEPPSPEPVGADEP